MAEIDILNIFLNDHEIGAIARLPGIAIYLRLTKIISTMSTAQRSAYHLKISMGGC